MPKTMEELLAERAKIEKELEQAAHQEQRVDNRIEYCEAGNRRQRTHHLITRGAAVESIAPEVKPLTEAEYYTMMENIFDLPEVRTAVLFASVDHEKAEHPEKFR